MVKWVCVPSQGYNYKQCKFVAKGQHDDFHLEMFEAVLLKLTIYADIGKYPTKITDKIVCR